jgi:precorrin-3B methylase
MSTHHDRRPVWPFDIGIVGTGIVGAHQLTREAEEVIRRSRRTFVIESGYGITDYVETLCPEVTNLGPLYELGKSRMPTYMRMAAEVVDAALEEGPVCLAAYGHPWVYCYPTTLICRAAPLLGLHVEVFPGISSFDTLLVDLGVDIAFDGLQMYEATDLLLRRRPIMTDVTCVIWQATIVGDPTYPEQAPTAEQFLPLQEHLLAFYPPEHEATLVMSKTYPLLRSTVERFALGELAQALERAAAVGTLYIPALAARPIADTELLERMYALERRPGRPAIGPQPPG